MSQHTYNFNDYFNLIRGGEFNNVYTEPIKNVFPDNVWHEMVRRAGLEKNWKEQIDAWKKSNFIGDDFKNSWIHATAPENREFVSGHSQLYNVELQLGGQLQTIFNLVTEILGTADTFLSGVITVIEVISSFQKFITVNPVLLLIDAVIADIEELMASIEQVGIFVLPILPSDSYRGTANLINTTDSAFAYAQQFVGIEDRIQATSEIFGKQIKGAALKLRTAYKQDKELTEKQTREIKMAKVFEYMSTSGPGFKADDIVGGVGLIINLTDFAGVSKFISQFSKIWDFDDKLTAAKTFAGFGVTHKRIKHGARFNWPALDGLMINTTIPRTFSGSELTLSSVPVNIKCNPHIRISLYRPSFDTTKKPDDPKYYLKTTKENYKDDKPYKDMWICGVGGGAGADNDSAYNKKAVESFIDNVDKYYTIIKYKPEVQDDVVMPVEIYVSKKETIDASITPGLTGVGIGNKLVYPIYEDENQADTARFTYKVRVYTNESFMTSPGDEYTSLHESGPYGVDDDIISNDLPILPAPSALSPWIGKKLVEAVPQLKDVTNIIRNTMYQLRDSFDSINNPLEEMLKQYNYWKNVIIDIISRVQKSIDVLEDLIEFLTNPSYGFTAWNLGFDIDRKDGEGNQLDQGNDFLREELIGSFLKLKEDGRIKDNQLTCGVFFIAGIPRLDETLVENTAAAFETFKTLFGLEE